MIENLTVVDHALVRDILSSIRSKDTTTAEFRRLLGEIGLLLGHEVTRDLPLHQVEVETPLAHIRAPRFDGQGLTVVSILRAGNGLLQGMLDLVPAAPVGLIGLQRDPDTLEAREYYFKVPATLLHSRVVTVDPMLATGHTAIAAIARLKKAGATDIRMVCVVAAPEGLHAFRAAHPDVPVIAAAVDEGLDTQGHIVPGIGDAGDRLYGTAS
jgi:uracil phosphoribosyltransferase